MVTTLSHLEALLRTVALSRGARGGEADQCRRRAVRQGREGEHRKTEKEILAAKRIPAMRYEIAQIGLISK